jgi:hypothetical protein
VVNSFPPWCSISRMENKKFHNFFKEVIKEKHALVGFHKRLHIKWIILNCKFTSGHETVRLLSNIVGILNICIFPIIFFWCLTFCLNLTVVLPNFIYIKGLIIYMAML